MTPTLATAPRPPGTFSPACIVAATSFGFSLVQLDVTIVNVALPSIDTSLHLGIAGLQWIVDSYALVLASLLLSGGFLSDRFGAQRIYSAGIAVFALASLLCGLATTGPMLIGARAAQGIGAAAMLPSSLALLNHATAHDSRLRAWAIGWWTAISSISIAIGPIVGGLLLGVTSWRALFLINLPLCVVAMLFARRLRAVSTLAGVAHAGAAPAAPAAPADSNGRRAFDLPGQVLGICMIGATAAAVIEAKPLGIGHPFVIGMFAFGALSLLAFLRCEARAASPMLPLSIFKTRTFSVCMLYGSVVNFSYYGMVFVLSIYLQRVAGFSPMQAGLAYLPLTATFFVVNVLCGAVVNRFGSRGPMIWGAVVDALGFLMLLTLGAGSPYLAMVLPFILMPAGMGFGVPAMTTALLASVPKEFSGIASATLNAGRQAAGAIGVALFGALIGEQHADVVSGLHRAAVVAAVMLLAIALLVFRTLRQPARQDADA